MSTRDFTRENPLNRGARAIVGIGLWMAVFAVAGPAIGAVAAVGPLGFFILPVAYSVGLAPAMVTGAVFCGLWYCNVPGGRRAVLSLIVGGVASGVWVLVTQAQSLTLWIVWAGCVSGLVCAALANLTIGVVEQGQRN